MGVQRLMSQMKGAQRRCRESQRMNEERNRRMRTPRTYVGELNGVVVHRKCIGEQWGTIHAQANHETVDTGVQRMSAGSAFAWWTGMSAAEREAFIARVTAEDKDYRSVAQARAKAQKRS